MERRDTRDIRRIKTEARELKKRSDIIRDQLKSEISKELEELKRKAREHYGNAKLKAIEMKDKSGQYIRENPHKSVITAAAIGVAVGAVLTGILKGNKNKNYKE